MKILAIITLVMFAQDSKTFIKNKKRKQFEVKHKKEFIMKTVIYSIIIVFISSSLFAQSYTELSKREQRKLERQDRKEKVVEQRNLESQRLQQMMQDNAFVLEADMLYNRYGNSVQVQQAINFVMVDSLYGVIQLGNDYGIGRNGVGGVTIEGKVTDYEELKNEKKGVYAVNYTLQSPVGTYFVSLNALSASNAEATIRGNFGEMIRYSGKLVHPENSMVYQGSAF